MADNTNNKVDMSAIAFDLAKAAGLADDKTKFEKFEKDFVKKFYELIGLSDIPEEFLDFTKFLDAYSSILVKSVQNDLAIMNLTKRLSMYKLSESIAQTGEKKDVGARDPAPGETGTETPAPEAK